MPYVPAYHLKLYRNFKALDAQNFHGIVRYYEQHEDGIRTLEIDEYFDCTLLYCEALFEIGELGKHIVMCDHLLEFIIMENIQTWGGEDVYGNILYKKAAAQFQQQDYAKSEHILRELLKLHPQHHSARVLLNQCLIHQKPLWLMHARAAFVGLILLSAGIIALEIFVVRVFFKNWTVAVEWTRNLLALLAVLVLSGAELRHSWRCSTKVRRFIQAIRARHCPENPA